MYKIIRKEQLSAVVWLMEVEAPLVARHCQPGQFVIVKDNEIGERIPLTICDYDREKGTITIVFQPLGVATNKFMKLNEGDSFEDFVGPLGRPSDIVEMSEEELAGKKFLFVAGGVGTAPVYPQVKWLKEHGYSADVIIGARTKDLLFFEEEMRAVAGNLYITTDDGSYVHKGVVTSVIDELVA
ncbi:MAG: sulfide/dihydroorotate dehydrogenase-like FAD/NAD-binding protein, partial [Lachnospiraceae bacterium]|nr:sulfide/dihydroorotate dehydrogenase-like FAD/NAD-binding protein [Lachnospiraceae bacterium]